MAEQRVNRPVVVACLTMATFMQSLDTTIANVCLPHIQGSVSASLDEIEWVLTSYLVASAILTPAVGWLAGRYGARRILLACVVGFTLTSILCGAATTLDQIVAFRLFQGAFAAAMMPLPQAMLLDLYPREKHTAVLSLWSMVASMGPFVGPTLGGWLTENYGWRWVFYVNVPVGLLITLGGMATIPKDKSDRSRRLDMTGFLLCSVAIGAFQLMLARGETLDWFDSTEICIEALIAAVTFYLLIVHCLTSPAPFIKPRMFANPDYLTGCTIMFLGVAVTMALMALMTPFTQTLMGYPVLTSGILQGPRALGGIVVSAAIPFMLRRIGARNTVMLGLAVSAFSLWLMSGYTADVSFDTLMANNVLMGIAFSLVIVPTAPLAFASLAPQDRAEGSAIFSLGRSIGGSTGIAFLTSQLIRDTQINHAEITSHVTPTARLFQAPEILRHWNPLTPHGAAALDAVIDQQASTIAFVSDFRLMMIVALAMIPIVALMRAPPPGWFGRRQAPAPAE